MFRFRHRLSKDIEFFGYDAQWLALLSPRLNETAAAMASGYGEQANGVKIVMSEGDIDFIVAGDVAVPASRERTNLEGRDIGLDPASAREAVWAAASKAALLLRRLDEMASGAEDRLLEGIVPFEGQLRHADRMVSKVRDFIENETAAQPRTGGFPLS